MGMFHWFVKFKIVLIIRHNIENLYGLESIVNNFKWLLLCVIVVQIKTILCNYVWNLNRWRIALREKLWVSWPQNPLLGPPPKVPGYNCVIYVLYFYTFKHLNINKLNELNNTWLIFYTFARAYKILWYIL